MIGLTYIRNWMGTTMEALAGELGTSKQNISLWENDEKRKIPKRYLPMLEKKFGVPEKYFQITLSELDELNVQEAMLSKLIHESTFIYEEEIYDSDTGKTITVEREHVDNHAVEYLEALKADQKEVQLIVKLKQSVRNTSKYGFNITETTSLRDYTYCQKDNIKLYDRFIDIVNCESIENNLLHQIMRAIELLDEQLSDEKAIWGEKNEMDISSVSDENPIVQELFVVLRNHATREKQLRAENIRLAKEYMKELGITEEDLINPK